MVLFNVNRVIAAVILGLFGGWFIRHDLDKWHSLGRDAFMAYQAHRFDVTYVALPPAAFTIVFTIALTILLIGCYEVLVFALSRVIKPTVETARNF